MCVSNLTNFCIYIYIYIYTHIHTKKLYNIYIIIIIYILYYKKSWEQNFEFFQPKFLRFLENNEM